MNVRGWRRWPSLASPLGTGAFLVLLGVIGCVKTLLHIAHEFHDHRVAEFILPGRVARTRVRPWVRAGRNGTVCYRRSVLVIQ